MSVTLEQALQAIAQQLGDNGSQFLDQMTGFQKLISRFQQQKQQGTSLDWSKIQTLTNKDLVDYEQLTNNVELSKDQISKLLDRLVVLKLNGGLGTTMGCTGPKSVINVRDSATFLDLTVQQIQNLNKVYNSSVPLVLMNSFNTQEDTEKVVDKYIKQGVQVLMFQQKQFPRVWADNLLPMAYNGNQGTSDNAEWYPPGHGDVYDSFYRSEFFQDLKKNGKDIVFISNIDNLGATVDMNILNHIASNNIEFAMEVTPKTRADVKGGTLVSYEGRVSLLELAQVPKDKVEEFKSIRKFKVFNTNNMWINMNALEKQLPDLNLDIIVNGKVAKGRPIIQLETAAGAAIKHFSHSIGINVPRTRFLPVKNCSDLMLVQSNLYASENGTLVLNPERLEKAGDASIPVIKLGPEFQHVGNFSKRFGSIPDILELDHLTVSGDVVFGPKVSLKGTVIIIAEQGSHIDIPAGSVLENKIVSGGLRIIDN